MTFLQLQARSFTDIKRHLLYGMFKEQFLIGLSNQTHIQIMTKCRNGYNDNLCCPIFKPVLWNG